MIANSFDLSGQYEELLEIVNPLERNKIELDDWAVSGAIYYDFFVLKSSFQNDDSKNELVSYLLHISVEILHIYSVSLRISLEKCRVRMTIL